MTLTQFLRQLEALGSDSFELGVKCSKTNAMERRCNQTVQQLIKSVKWLQYKNTNGYHIYIRPEEGEAVILVDDITIPNLLKMDRDNIRAACVVETSDLNYQVWVRVAKEPISPEVATCIGEILATRYNADLGSKDFRHFGRAVGFTNVKPEHQLESGLFPYCKIIEAKGGVTPNGSQLIKEGVELAKLKKKQEEEVRKSLLKSHKQKPGDNVQDRFASAVKHIFDQYGANTDPSRADASAALHLLFEGYSVDDVTKAMLESDDIRERRPRSHVDYVQRTVKWACDRGGLTNK